jgi:hypothetical protein
LCDEVFDAKNFEASKRTGLKMVIMWESSLSFHMQGTINPFVAIDRKNRMEKLAAMQYRIFDDVTVLDL